MVDQHLNIPIRILILANRDPTSSSVFRPVCEDARVEVVGVSFTSTLTKSKNFWRGVLDVFKASGLSYFAYISFWNGVFTFKEWLIWHLPFLGRLFTNFFSLRLWARDHNVEIVFSNDFNSQDFINFVNQHRPDVLFTRINQILREPILQSTRHGCWCFHSSELPRYQGIAAEFHSLLNGEKTVGFTVMKMEPKLDAGPIIGQGSTAIPRGITLHSLIEHNYTNAHRVIRKMLDDFLSDTIKYSSQDPSLKSYYSWPNSNQTQAFRRKGFRFICFKQCVSYILG